MGLKCVLSQVTVVEARLRVGGRCLSTSLGDLRVDLGASWIHGTRDNPLTQLACEAK